jgi:hypothetical protein
MHRRDFLKVGGATCPSRIMYSPDVVITLNHRFELQVVKNRWGGHTDEPISWIPRMRCSDVTS